MPRAAFPPRPPAVSPRSNLPAQISSFVGREKELNDLRALLVRADVRLVTLTGPGGTGKTRLALAVAAELLDRFPDGIFFVDLAPISDPELVVAAIAQTLGVLDAGNQPLADRLKSALRTKDLLLLLDNFEQVLEAAPLLAELLAAAPGLKILVTSRVVLHLSGEHEYVVPPLALPPADDRRRTTDDARGGVAGGQSSAVSQYAAVQLFIERAQAAKADFAVTNANAPAVAEICVRLDGLPLAIELAAARVKLFPPEALLNRLSAPLALLTGGARDRPTRQQTIRNTIDWSYNLLSADEQQLFRRLGVFVGGWTVEAAEAVCAGDAGWGMGNGSDSPNPKPQPQNPQQDGLATLLDHSLLVVLEPVEGEPRYGMLETLREYALERLRAAGEEMAVRRRHAAYLLELVEAIGPKVGGPESRKALAQLEAELPNIRVAFVWAGERGEHDLELRFAGTLLPLWLERGHRSEGRALIATALSRPTTGLPNTRAWALNALGRLSWRDADRWPETSAAFEESLAIFRALGNLDGSAEVLSHLAFIELLQGDIERATVLQTESLRAARAAGNKRRTAWALQDLARYAFLNGDDVRGHSLLEESQSLFQELQDQGGYAVGRLTLGLALQGQGDSAQALALLRESAPRYFGWALLRESDYRQSMDVLQEGLAECRQAREFERIPQILNMLGEAALALGNFLEARARFQESRALCRELGNTWDTAGTLLGEGHVALAEGDHAAASACYADAVRRFAGLPDWDHRRRRTGVAACLEGLAGIVAPERATRLYGAAAGLRAAVGRAALQEFDLAYPLPGNRAVNDLALAVCRAALGDTAFDAAWAAGQALTLEQAVAEALAVVEPLISRPAPVQEI